MVKSKNSIVIETASGSGVLSVESPLDMSLYGKLTVTLPDGAQFNVSAQDLIAAATNASNIGYNSTDAVDELRDLITKQP